MKCTRRQLLQGAGSWAALASTPWGALAFEENPVTASRAPTLVLLFLRGGADGLNLLVPHGEPAYYELRPGIAIPRPGGENSAVDLDGFFGLHPAAAALAPLFAEGLAAAIPAIGHGRNTRSHFEEQDRLETAIDDNLVSTSGWLSRHLQTSQGRGPVRALALGESLPRSLRGEVNAISLRGLADLALPGSTQGADLTLAALDRAYGGKSASRVPASLGAGGQASLKALEELRVVASRADESTVEFPDSGLGRRAREAARLIRADLGLEVIELDLGGWDTHLNQGGARGTYADRVRELAEALHALVRDLESRMHEVCIVTLTEFGRTAAQNGTNGTDHGWASCALLLGGVVQASRARRAGPILGRWPGLEREVLNQGRDLAHSTDFRDLYAELLGFLGNARVAEVLPGHEPTPIGLL
jgi:uncharacterized protein (DUF1501 family)